MHFHLQSLPLARPLPVPYHLHHPDPQTGSHPRPGRLLLIVSVTGKKKKSSSAEKKTARSEKKPVKEEDEDEDDLYGEEVEEPEDEPKDDLEEVTLNGTLIII